MAAITLPTPRPAPKPRVWEPLKVWRRRLAARLMRERVTNRNFSIISNDCFGGMAYEELGIRYESPFVGLFLVIEDYMQLLRRPQFYCGQPIQFKARSRHPGINDWRENVMRKDYPIGVLGDDVEIQFLHYASRDEAAAKWARRARRMQWENLLVKLSWHDDPRMDSWLREFDGMSFACKLSLVPRAMPSLRSCVELRHYSTDGTAQYWMAHRCFDVAHWINEGVIRRATWSRVADWLLYWRY